MNGNYKSRNYKSRNNGQHKRIQEQPRPAFMEEPGAAFMEDCAAQATREVCAAFRDCAARAFSGEPVLFEWELAKVTGAALGAMAALEGYPLNEEITKEGALCFDGYRDSFEIEAAAALAEWKKYIVPALERLAIHEKYI